MLCHVTNRNRELLLQSSSYDQRATLLRYARVNNPQDRAQFNRLYEAMRYEVGRSPCIVEDLNREERMADFYYDTEGRFVRRGHEYE